MFAIQTFSSSDFYVSKVHNKRIHHVKIFFKWKNLPNTAGIPLSAKNLAYSGITLVFTVLKIDTISVYEWKQLNTLTSLDWTR